MAAPTFDSVSRATQTTGAAGANREYGKAFWFFVKLGPTEGAAAMGMKGNTLGFVKMAQKGAFVFAEQFKRAMNV